jgi:protein-disulfide isomerase
MINRFVKIIFSVLISVLLVFKANIVFSSTITKDVDYLRINNTDVIIGDVKAKVEVISYLSFSCPACAVFHSSLYSRIKKEYIDTGKVKWAFRSYARDAPSLQGGMLIKCMPKGKYSKMIDVLFDKQSSWAFTKNSLEVLSNIANIAGVDKKDFDQCMGDKKIEDQLIEQTMIAVNDFNIKATPSFIIDGKIVEYKEIPSIEAFRKYLETVLKNE